MSTAAATNRSPRTIHHSWVKLAVILVLLLATGLRFYGLDAQSFWNDEGNSARLSERSIPLIIEGTASDIHPPLY
jgi:predicted membrane-bound mannosyltransferase